MNETILVHSGDTVAFLGASITEAGWANSTGYLQLIVKALSANGVEIVPAPAGVSGNTSRDMLARLDKDVLPHKPTWVTIDAGRNDVWHGTVDFAEYMSNLTVIVNRLQAAGSRIVLQTITPIGEDSNEFNAKLAYSNAFIRYLAAQKHCLLCDMDAAFAAALQDKKGDEDLLTTDGVHMNERGDRVLAECLLGTFGLTNVSSG